MITVSVVNPPLKSSIIDRYIIATRKGGMEPLIVINKIDLLENAKEYDPILLEQEKQFMKKLYELMQMQAFLSLGQYSDEARWHRRAQTSHA